MREWNEGGKKAKGEGVRGWISGLINVFNDQYKENGSRFRMNFTF